MQNPHLYLFTERKSLSGNFLELTSPTDLRVYDKVRKAATFIAGTKSGDWSCKLHRARYFGHKLIYKTIYRTPAIKFVNQECKDLQQMTIANLLSQENQKAPLSRFYHLISDTHSKNVQNTCLPKPLNASVALKWVIIQLKTLNSMFSRRIMIVKLSLKH